MRKAGLIATGAVLVGLSGVAFATTASAAAPCAKLVTMTFSSQNLSLVVSPGVEKIRVGDCVAFANDTKSEVDVTVSGGNPAESVTLAAGATTPRSGAYAPKSAGSHTVKGTAKSLGLSLASTTGTITVTPAPSASPTPSSGSPSPSGGHSSSPSAHPDVAPSPKHSKRSATPTPHATGISLPPLPPLPTSGQTAVPLGSNPVVAPVQPSLAPTTTGSASPSSSTAVVAGPLEPTDNNQRGLPEAVGVCVVLGLATGWGRVLLASPDDTVDDEPLGDHRL